MQNERIVRLQNIQQAAEIDGHAAPKLDASIVLEARSRLPIGKCDGGGDHTASEMIKLLPIAIIYIVTDLFSVVIWVASGCARIN